jgi:hypothetical protein
MRVLVDSTFPVTTSGPQPRGHHIDRYADTAISDTELVALAKRQGYEMVVFLGPDSLADPRVAAASETYGVLVAATSSDDPDEAEVAVKTHLPALASRVGISAPFIVRKLDVVPAGSPH